MANKCINQLILTGARENLFNLILSNELNYNENEIHEINTNCFCLVFFSEWEPPEEDIADLSIKHPKIKFELYYIEKLLKKLGKIVFINGEKIKTKKKYNSSLFELSKTITSEIFNGL